MEAVLPRDLEYGSPKVKGYDENANQRAREDSLDQLDEARTVALMHSAFGKVPAGAKVVPSTEDTAPRLQRRELSPKAAPKQLRPPQAVTSVGGALCCGEST
jgi:hypothetical protein